MNRTYKIVAMSRKKNQFSFYVKENVDSAGIFGIEETKHHQPSSLDPQTLEQCNNTE
jgi:hypothetical protein